MVDLSNSINDLSNYKMDCEGIYEETKLYKNSFWICEGT